MSTVQLFLLTGVFAGLIAGLFGVGGGVVIVPILTLLFHYHQVQATGTSLVALLLPVGMGGVYSYYAAGKIDWADIQVGLCISVGMVLGTYVGAKVALLLPEIILKRAFAVFLVATAARTWWSTRS